MFAKSNKCPLVIFIAPTAFYICAVTVLDLYTIFILINAPFVTLMIIIITSLPLNTFLMGNIGDITKFMLSLPKTFIRINMVDAFMMYINMFVFLTLGLLI